MERIELSRDETTKGNIPRENEDSYLDICITYEARDPSEKPVREAPIEYDLDLFKATGIRPNRSPQKTF